MIRSLFSFLHYSFKSKAQLQFENIYLRKQIEILKRSSIKPKIKKSDRIFFTVMKNLITNWKKNLFIIKPETVIKWHRQGFNLYWKIKSRKKNGRPKIEKELRLLIRQISFDNPLWGVPRIHGELLKLGYKISQSTVL